MVFPVIHSIDDIMPVIAGRDEFLVIKKEHYTVVDYAVCLPDTFPEYDQAPDSQTLYLWQLRRECRGLKFSSDGRVIGRGYHKFFNIGERRSSQPDAVDWTKPFRILEKLDGSMINAVILRGEVRYMTMLGLTEVAAPAEEHARSHGYNSFCRAMITRGYTPIFEWCSQKMRIVVDYPEDRLILTALRHMESGDYLSYDLMEAAGREAGIPVVRTWPNTWAGIQAFLEHVREEQEGEGWILRFDDGRMYKTKNLRYRRIHKAKEGLTQEKDVWAMVVQKRADDILPDLPPLDRERLERFMAAFWDAVAVTARRISQEVASCRQAIATATQDAREAKKRFAQDHARRFRGLEAGIAFRIYDGFDPLGEVAHVIGRKIFTGPQLEEVRDLAGGIRWENF